MTNLPLLAKVTEKVLAVQLQTLPDDTGYLDPFQSSFWLEYRTETILAALVDDLRQGLDKEKATILDLLDLLAIFDTADHSILLDFLVVLGTESAAFQWFLSFLSEHIQNVVLGKLCLTTCFLSGGIPKGVTFSPQ